MNSIFDERPLLTSSPLHPIYPRLKMGDRVGDPSLQMVYALSSFLIEPQSEDRQAIQPFCFLLIANPLLKDPVKSAPIP
jgi:hypothetical protein